MLALLYTAIPISFHYLFNVGELEIPEVPFREEEMAGSGAGAGFESNNTGNMLTPFSQSDEGFSVVPGEQVGQLYAYRINASAVILGTRRASVFGASVGIGAGAGGVYECRAKNDNADRVYTITINIQSEFWM